MTPEEEKRMALKERLAILASILLVVGVPVSAAYLWRTVSPLPGSTPGESAKDIFFLLRTMSPYIIILIGGLSGWWVSRIFRKNLERKLGRKLRSDIEATSLSAWMEASEGRGGRPKGEGE